MLECGAIQIDRVIENIPITTQRYSQWRHLNNRRNRGDVIGLHWENIIFSNDENYRVAEEEKDRGRWRGPEDSERR